MGKMEQTLKSEITRLAKKQVRATWPRSLACRAVRLGPGSTGRPSPKATTERRWWRCENWASARCEESWPQRQWNRRRKPKAGLEAGKNDARLGELGVSHYATTIK